MATHSLFIPSPKLSPLPPPSNPNPTSKCNPITTNRRRAVVAFSSSSSPSFRNGRSPETECPVPPEQQPVNEYQDLSTSLLFSWAAADLRFYAGRLTAVGAVAGVLLGLPVSAFGTGSVADPRCAVGTAAAGLLAATLAVLRMYLGWAYVGNRLLSATVEYEETGWYDGQIWVKTPEVLARDRLLGSFYVKPVLSRVKLTLVGLGVALVACALLFINIENSRAIVESSRERAISGVYNDATARSFEPDAFCGEPDLSET